jgi:hypothetical protein
MGARARIELAYGGCVDLSLPTWVPRLMLFEPTGPARSPIEAEPRVSEVSSNAASPSSPVHVFYCMSINVLDYISVGEEESSGKLIGWLAPGSGRAFPLTGQVKDV